MDDKTIRIKLKTIKKLLEEQNLLLASSYIEVTIIYRRRWNQIVVWVNKGQIIPAFYPLLRQKCRKYMNEGVGLFFNARQDFNADPDDIFIHHTIQHGKQRD